MIQQNGLYLNGISIQIFMMEKQEMHSTILTDNIAKNINFRLLILSARI